jgi:hypothetical protein
MNQGFFFVLYNFRLHPKPIPSRNGGPYDFDGRRQHVLGDSFLSAMPKEWFVPGINAPDIA